MTTALLDDETTDTEQGETLAQRAARAAAEIPQGSLVERARRAASELPVETLAQRAARLASQQPTETLSGGEGLSARAARLAATPAHDPGGNVDLGAPVPRITSGPIRPVGVPASEVERVGLDPFLNEGSLAKRIANRMAMAHAPEGYTDAGRDAPLDRAAGAVGEGVRAAVTAPVSSLVRTLSPGVGEARPNLTLGKGGNSSGRPIDTSPYDSAHGGVTRAERTNAGVQTLANLLAPELGPVAGGMAVGAAYDPEDRVHGAMVGGALGTVLHGALHAPAILDAVARAPSAVQRITRGLANDGRAPVAGEVAASSGSVPAESLAEKAARLAEAPADGDLATAGGERFSGLPLATKVRAAIRTGYRSAMVTPYASIEAEHPALVDALHKAGAAPARALDIGTYRVDRVLEGMTPEQVDAFGAKRVFDRMTAEAERKGDAADALMQEHAGLSAEDLHAKLDGHVTSLERRAASLPASDTAKYALTRDAASLRAQLAGASTADLASMADQQFAKPLWDAADNFRQHAAKLAPTVPQGIEHDPWFQEAQARHEQDIGAPLRADAAAAGVDPATMLEGDKYTRLISEQRANDADIRRAMDANNADDMGTLTPRSALVRKLLGEKPGVDRIKGFGADAAREGPLQPDAGGSIAGPTSTAKRVGVTGSAQMAEGTAESYITDYRRIIEQDARDKSVKAARNAVYGEVAKIGRPLAAGELPTPGKAALSFDDAKGLTTGDAGTQRFEVSKDVSHAVNRFHDGLTQSTSTDAGKWYQKLRGALTKAQIAGMPVEATSHANTLASIVASVPGEANAIGTGLSLVPGGGAKASAIRELYATDFADPETHALRNRLADIGALRIEEPHEGLVNAAHNWLFGPTGVDVRGRLALARKYLDVQPDASDPALREFLTSKLGNYIKANSGALPNALQDAGVSAFARFQAARIPSSIRSTFGASGLPGEGMAKAKDVAETLYRGPIGTLIGGALINRILSGHNSTENERGHSMDVQLGYGGKGAYLVNGSLKRLTDDEAKELGSDARPIYLPGSTLNPVLSTGLRASGMRAIVASDRQGPGKLADASRDIANTALGVMSPFWRAASVVATGRTPYLSADGSFMKTTPTRFNKDRELTDRLKAAALEANPAVSAFAGQAGEAGGRTLAGSLAKDGEPLGGTAATVARVASFIFPRVATVGVGGVDNQLSADARDSKEYTAAMTDYKYQMRRAPGPQAKEEILARAAADARSAGYDESRVLAALEKGDTGSDIARRARQEKTVARFNQRARADDGAPAPSLITRLRAGLATP